ncbi:hypothetical protein FPOAC2_10070 [Fusarium poae]|uniref:Uncharacterized protein n=1 Tax=Fusarium poae TaxID=36050 RepID=A0A1B8AQR1_FUSPO|nr:hypothetical protein FPOA_09222 [Fusarium poae]
MAEIVGLVASIPGLLELGIESSKALHKLQSQLRNAPDLIHALANETEDIKLVLTLVEDSLKASEAAALDTPSSIAVLDKLKVQLRKAKTTLEALELFTQKLADETPTTRRVKWLLQESQASKLQSDLKVTRAQIMQLQVAYSESASTRMECVLRDVQLLQHSQNAATQRLGSHIVELDKATDMNKAAIATALQIMQASASDMPPQYQLINHQNAEPNGPTLPMRMSPDQLDTPIQNTPSLMNSILSFTIGLQQSTCSNECLCKCHAVPRTHRSWNLIPKALQAVTGTLFIGYTSNPTSASKCNHKRCARGRAVRLVVKYGFPLWFLNYALHMVFESSARNHLSLALTPRRRIIIKLNETDLFCQIGQGHLVNIQRILRTNRAAVLDVWEQGDQSPLLFAMHALVPWNLIIEMIKMLVQAGADLDQTDDAGMSARHRLAIYQFTAELPLSTELLFNVSSCYDDFDLTFIHRIVIGQCPIDMASVLASGSPDLLAQVNEPDYFGYTPLIYAVRRKDVATVKALLDAGATTDNVSRESGGVTALGMAMAAWPDVQKRLAITELLLKAGADVEVANSFGATPLIAAANNNHAAAIEMLVAAGANIEARMRDGFTPIMSAAKQNAVAALQTLHRLGANLYVHDIFGTSILRCAVMSNAHDTLRVLLELGADYLSEDACGHVLHTAATVGDLQTFRTLMEFRFPGLDPAAKEAAGWTPHWLFHERSDITDELRYTFYDLLRAVDADQHRIDEESGGESSDAEDEFVDTKEYLYSDNAV